MSDLRQLGCTGIRVAPVALGCWPMAGVTTIGATDEASIATIHAALDAGINHLDTAFVYGPNGESDRLIGRALAGRRRAEVVLATKCGIHYEGAEMQTDGRPATLRRECEASLARLGVSEVELLYLHSPDPHLPLEESAAELGRLQAEGKTKSVGASNCTLEQLQVFHAVCPLAAVQLPYNLLQRDIERRTIPWCVANNISVFAYWPLMKGILAGGITKETELAVNDNRRKYPMYVGDERDRNHEFVEALRAAAALTGHTVAQLVVNWTMNQPGITAALCGAKRPEQITETAGAMSWQLTEAQTTAIDAALARRGKAEAKRVFE